MHELLPFKSLSTIRATIARSRCLSNVLSSSHQIKLSSRVTLTVERKGNGNHGIVCIPGALGTALSDYAPQLEHFGRQGSPFTIVAFDPRGYGSSRPPERDFSIEPIHFLNQDGLDAHNVMNKLGFKSYSVLGWSDGGIAGMFLAGGPHSQAVKKLVIWGANAYLTQEDINCFEKTRNIADWSARMREPLEAIYGQNFPSLWSNWIDSMVATLEDGGDLCMSEVSRISCPTLVLHGDKDPMVPPFHPTYINQSIANSCLKTFPLGKHNIHLKYAHEFNEEVEQFLLN